MYTLHPILAQYYVTISKAGGKNVNHVKKLTPSIRQFWTPLLGAEDQHKLQFAHVVEQNVNGTSDR